MGTLSCQGAHYCYSFGRTRGLPLVGPLSATSLTTEACTATRRTTGPLWELSGSGVRYVRNKFNFVIHCYMMHYRTFNFTYSECRGPGHMRRLDAHILSLFRSSTC